ncbi:hypothetical protein RUND412_000372 [Rhizina undulata]
MDRIMDSLFNLVLTRDQRERHSRAKWEKSVAKSAEEIVSRSSVDGNREVSDATTPIVAAPAKYTSQPMSPCPSNTSIESGSSTSSSSTVTSPTRPNTSYSISPKVDVPKRYTSITRNPISYDCLMDQKAVSDAEHAAKEKRDKATAAQPLLYALPPLGPMEGFGKYRRSIHVTESFIDGLRKDNFDALKPLEVEEEEEGGEQVEARVASGNVEVFPETRGRKRSWRRGSGGNRDTTTPPRCYSESPNALDREEFMGLDSDEAMLEPRKAKTPPTLTSQQQQQWEEDFQKWANNKKPARTSPVNPPKRHDIEIVQVSDDKDEDFEDLPEIEAVLRKPIRVQQAPGNARRRQPIAQAPVHAKERNAGGVIAVPRAGRNVAGAYRKTGTAKKGAAKNVVQAAHRNTTVALKKIPPPTMSASMETLVSGEE